MSRVRVSSPAPPLGFELGWRSCRIRGTDFGELRDPSSARDWVGPAERSPAESRCGLPRRVEEDPTVAPIRRGRVAGAAFLPPFEFACTLCQLFHAPPDRMVPVSPSCSVVPAPAPDPPVRVPPPGRTPRLPPDESLHISRPWDIMRKWLVSLHKSRDFVGTTSLQDASIWRKPWASCS
jgi:hypothetical protein